MAVYKNRLLRKGASGETYDTIHLETSSDMVMRPSGGTVESDMSDMAVVIAGKSPIGHTHNLNDLDGFDAFKDKLGIQSSVSSGSSYKIDGITLGNVVTWANEKWVICHIDMDRFYLARCTALITGTCAFNTGLSGIYAGSVCAQQMLEYQNTIPADSLALALDTTVHNVTAKIFSATADQIFGGFSYFANRYNRVIQEPNYTNASVTAYAYWLSSPANDQYGGVVVNRRAYMCDYEGYLQTAEANSNYDAAGSYVYRPFVALKR